MQQNQINNNIVFQHLAVVEATNSNNIRRDNSTATIYEMERQFAPQARTLCVTVSVTHMSGKNYSISFLRRNVGRINTLRTERHPGPDSSHLTMTPVCGNQEVWLFKDI